MKKVTLGFAMCGSFCTFSKVIEQMKKLSEEYRIVPIMSNNAYTIDTRFGKAKDFVKEVEDITKRSKYGTNFLSLINFIPPNTTIAVEMV